MMDIARVTSPTLHFFLLDPQMTLFGQMGGVLSYLLMLAC